LLVPFISAWCYTELPDYLICEQNVNCTVGFTISNETGVFLGDTNVIITDNLGNEIYRGNVSSNGGYFYVVLNTTQTSEIGWHQIFVLPEDECAGSPDGTSFQITSSGSDLLSFCCEETPRDTTTGISIVIFILFITGSLFLFSFKKDLFKNQFVNIIARRSLLTLGIYLMILNSAIMATLAASSNLPLVQEMFTYMNLFGFIGYPAMILLMLSALLQSFKDMKQNKKNKRTGEEDEQ